MVKAQGDGGTERVDPSGKAGGSRMNAHNLTRRGALGAAGAMVAGALGRSAPVSMPPPSAMERQEAQGRVLAPRVELVNTLEYEEQAKRTLAPAVFAHIAGGDRASFDRITLRPRLLVPTLDLDLGVTLFGDRLFAPVVVGPIADQTTVSCRRRAGDGQGRVGGQGGDGGQQPFERPAAGNRGAGRHAALVSGVCAATPQREPQIQDAVNAGCKAICVTVGAVPPIGERARRRDRRESRLGGRRCAQAGHRRAGAGEGHRDARGRTTRAAARRGGIIVSNYGGPGGVAARRR